MPVILFITLVLVLAKLSLLFSFIDLDSIFTLRAASLGCESLVADPFAQQCYFSPGERPLPRFRLGPTKAQFEAFVIFIDKAADFILLLPVKVFWFWVEGMCDIFDIIADITRPIFHPKFKLPPAKVNVEPGVLTYPYLYTVEWIPNSFWTKWWTGQAYKVTGMCLTTGDVLDELFFFQEVGSHLWPHTLKHEDVSLKWRFTWGAVPIGCTPALDFVASDFLAQLQPSGSWQSWSFAWWRWPYWVCYYVWVKAGYFFILVKTFFYDYFIFYFIPLSFHLVVKSFFFVFSYIASLFSFFFTFIFHFFFGFFYGVKSIIFWIFGIFFHISFNFLGELLLEYLHAALEGPVTIVWWVRRQLPWYFFVWSLSAWFFLFDLLCDCIYALVVLSSAFCYFVVVGGFYFILSFSELGTLEFFLFSSIFVCWVSGLLCFFNTSLYMFINHHLLKPPLAVFKGIYLEPGLRFLDLFVEQILAWYFHMQREDIFTGAGSLRGGLFRNYVNESIARFVIASKFFMGSVLRRGFSFFIRALVQSPLGQMFNPIMFFIQARLMGLKLRVDLRHYELSWHTLFTAHTFYYALLQIENIYSLLYSLRIYVGDGPAVDYIPEKPSAQEIPITERFIRLVTFFRPVDQDNVLPMEKYIVLADLSNLVLYIIYRIIYIIFYVFIAFFCLLIKNFLNLKVICLKIKRFFLKGFLRMQKTTVVQGLQNNLKLAFTFCYCFVSFFNLRKFLITVFVGLVEFLQNFFLIVFMLRPFTIIYTLLKFFFYLVIRKRFFFLLFWFFFFFGVYFTSIALLEFVHGVVLFYGNIIYYTFFYWPFYNFYYKATVISEFNYLFYWKRYHFFQTAASGFWPVWWANNILVKVFYFHQGFYYSISFEYYRGLYYFCKKYPLVSYFWEYWYYYWLEALAFAAYVIAPLWVHITWFLFSRTNFYNSIFLPFSELLLHVLMQLKYFFIYIYKDLFLFYFYALCSYIYSTRWGSFVWYYIRETDEAKFFWWVISCSLYDCLNFNVYFHFLISLIRSVVFNKGFLYLFWKLYLLKPLFIIEEWLDYWWNHYFYWSFTGFNLKYYQWVRFYTLFDEFALNYRLKPLSHEYHWFRRMRRFLFVDELFYEHYRSTRRYSSTASFFREPFVHWNIRYSQFWNFHNNNHYFSRGWRKSPLQLLALPRVFFLLFFAICLSNFSGFLRLLLLTPQKYFASQYSWTHFLDLKVKKKDVMQQLINVPEAVANMLYLHNKVGKGVSKAGIHEGFRDPGKKFWWYPLWTIKAKYGLKDDFTAKLDYLDLFKKYVDTHYQGNLHHKTYLQRILFPLWAQADKVAFFDYVLARHHALRRRKFQTKEEASAEDLQAINDYALIYKVDRELLMRRTKDVVFLKKWLQQKKLMRKLWVETRESTYMSAEDKLNTLRLLVVKNHLLDKVYKKRLRLFNPLMRQLAVDVFSKPFCNYIRYRKGYDFLPVISQDNEWLLKNHFCSTTSFSIFMAYMYRRDKDIAALWSHLPDCLDQELIEDLTDREFFYEMEYREQHFFEPVYKYFVRLDKYLYDYKLPYWAFHKDIDNDLLLSDTWGKHFGTDSKGRKYRNSTPLEYHRHPSTENCLLENWFYWFWIFPLFIAYQMYRWFFGAGNYAIWYELKHFFYNFLTSFHWGYSMEYWLAQVTLFVNITDESNNSAWYRDTAHLVDTAYAGRVIYGYQYWKQGLLSLWLNEDVGSRGYMHHWLSLQYHVTSRTAGCFAYRLMYWLAVAVILLWALKYLVPDYVLYRLQKLAKASSQQQAKYGGERFKVLHRGERYVDLVARSNFSSWCRTLAAYREKIWVKAAAAEEAYRPLSKWRQLLDFKHFYNLKEFHERSRKLQQLFYEKWRIRTKYANKNYYSTKVRNLKKKK